MNTGIFALCFILARAILNSHEAEVEGPPYNAYLAFYTKGTYYMKYRNYINDGVFGRKNCVSRWGGNVKLGDDPLTIRYEIKYYDGDPWTYQGNMEVLFNKTQIDTFEYDHPGSKNQQDRKLIYLNNQEQCQVTEILLENQQRGCTLWMGYYIVDEDPPTECETVYNKCIGSGSTKIGYHDTCKYEPLRKKKN